MDKALEKMTLEELWALFPITLTPYNPKWKLWAEDEIINLQALLSAYSPIINHIGSTAIPDIQAKPIIDLLVEVADRSVFSRIKAILNNNGYICMSDKPNRMSFNKGYTPNGYAERVFHIHLRVFGDNDEILFRDYLISHSNVAKEYEDLKIGLLSKYRNNRDSYTAAKSNFIQRVLQLAKEDLKLTGS